MNLIFIANKASWKMDEVANDAHVNASFYEPGSTNWASYAGQARIITDKEIIKKHWSPLYVEWLDMILSGGELTSV